MAHVIGHEVYKENKNIDESVELFSVASKGSLFFPCDSGYYSGLIEEYLNQEGNEKFQKYMSDFNKSPVEYYIEKGFLHQFGHILRKEASEDLSKTTNNTEKCYMFYENTRGLFACLEGYFMEDAISFNWPNIDFTPDIVLNSLNDEKCEAYKDDFSRYICYFSFFRFESNKIYLKDRLSVPIVLNNCKSFSDYNKYYACIVATVYTSAFDVLNADLENVCLNSILNREERNLCVSIYSRVVTSQLVFISDDEADEVMVDICKNLQGFLNVYRCVESVRGSSHYLFSPKKIADKLYQIGGNDIKK